MAKHLAPRDLCALSETCRSLYFVTQGQRLSHFCQDLTGKGVLLRYYHKYSDRYNAFIVRVGANTPQIRNLWRLQAPSVDLRLVEITNLPDDHHQALSELSTALPRLSCLERLGLHADLLPNELVFLGPALSQCKTLSSLNVAANRLNIRTVADLISICVQNRAIRRLDVGWNQIPDGEDPNALLPNPVQKCTNLVSLDCRQMRLPPNQLLALVSSLSQFPSLRVLSLSQNVMDERASSTLARVLSTLSKLERLEVEDNIMGDQNVVALLEALRPCVKLKSLNLSRNDMGTTSVETLIRLLPHLTRLVSLSLSGNSVSTPDFQRLFPPLAYLNISMLDLTKTNMTPEAAKFLARALTQDFRSLQLLDVSNNPMGNEGVRAICDGLLKRHNPLRSVEFRYTSIDEETRRTLIEQFKSKELPTYLDFCEN